MRQRIFNLISGLLLALVASVLPAQNDAPAESDLILILDGSNSMWGQIEGVNKIVIARESVGALIDKLPDGTETGLIAYGHRREGDCDDIEVLQAVAPVDKPSMKAAINAVTPKGKTPITASINTAIDLAREREGSAIVLISDGLETCDLDPCAAVRTAKADGVPFVLHVVGFDIGDEDTSQLECAAQEGGGIYVNAENAPELSDALEQAWEKPVTPDGRLVVTATAEGELKDALVIVTDAASGEHIGGGRTYTSAQTNPRRIPLDDGSYRAEVRAIGIKGSPTFEFDFEIVEGSAVERAFDFSAGDLAVTVTRNGELDDAVVHAYAAATDEYIGGGRSYDSPKSNPKVIRLAAGTYDVTIKPVKLKHVEAVRFENIVVSGGERAEVSHNFVSGDLAVQVRRGDTLVDATLNIAGADGRSVGAGRTYTSPNSNPKRFIVEPGEYRVQVGEIRGERREVSATVLAGEATSIELDLDMPTP